MNQILSTENTNNRTNRSKNSGGPKDIYSVIKFFAIVMLIFGIFLIINSSYAMIKNDGENNQATNTVEPTVEVEIKGEDKVLLKVMHEEGIQKITYSWNNENPTTVEGKGTKFYQKEIDIPNGINMLYVTATDVNGATKTYEEEFELNSNIVIDISISGNNIKIDLEGKEQIAEFQYAWDEEEPSKVDVNDIKYSMELEAPIGRHTLKVTATDINGEEQQEEQEVVGTTKPTIEVKKGDNAYLIIAHDEIGLDRIEITTLEDGKVTKIQSDGKDFEYSFPLKDSNDNFIEIVAYNENGVQSKTVKAKWPKQ